MLDVHGFSISTQTQKTFQNLANPMHKVGNFAAELFQTKNFQDVERNFNPFATEETENSVSESPRNARQAAIQEVKSDFKNDVILENPNQNNFLQQLGKKASNMKIETQNRLNGTRNDLAGTLKKDTLGNDVSISVDSKEEKSQVKTGISKLPSKRGGLFTNIEDKNDPVAASQFDNLQETLKEEEVRETRLKEKQLKIDERISHFNDMEYDIKKEMKSCITKTYEQLVKSPVKRIQRTVSIISLNIRNLVLKSMLAIKKFAQTILQQTTSQKVMVIQQLITTDLSLAKITLVEVRLVIEHLL